MIGCIVDKASAVSTASLRGQSTTFGKPAPALHHWGSIG
jgi:hypothetical protein